MSERIVELRPGENAPDGWRIVRVLGTVDVPAPNQYDSTTNVERSYLAVISDQAWLPSDFTQPAPVPGQPPWEITCGPVVQDHLGAPVRVWRIEEEGRQTVTTFDPEEYIRCVAHRLFETPSRIVT